jgi:uncharacterized protein with von Willebrand factor type A (vWA) domain
MSIAVLSDHGRLPENITYFCKALRRAGVPVGTAQILDAIRAVNTVGFTKRSDFRITLRACLIIKPDHFTVFEQVFKMFWRDPEFLDKMITNLLPAINTPPIEKELKPAQNRAVDAMSAGQSRNLPAVDREEIEVEATFSHSQTETLKNLDFEVMNNSEVAAAQRAIAQLKLPIIKRASRRYRVSHLGQRVDASAALRAARKTGGEVLSLPKRNALPRPVNLTVLCDISGSMASYSRMMMHFIHSVARKQGGGWGMVNAFTFGTRLTNITRALDVKDPDAALRVIGEHVKDWEGGTKIGTCLERFNKDWSRRVLGGSATVLLITDGLEREDVDVLSKEMQRLHLSCKDLIWLNPLLRWDAFEPQAMGIRAMLPHVDQFLACHNINSLTELADVLSSRRQTSELARMKALLT